MQTPAEKHLIKLLRSFLLKFKGSEDVPKFLNIGAGSSLKIERELSESGVPFLCDRVEIETVEVSGYNLRHCYQCSVESMSPVRSGEYNAVFANYLLEHVEYPSRAAAEIYRVLQPGGIFITSIPNPAAIEIMIARHTPLWFHKLVTGTGAWETHYAFKSIKALNEIFQEKGFLTTEIFYRSCLESYMERFILLDKLSLLYDGLFNKLQIKSLMNNVCIAFIKPVIADGNIIEDNLTVE